MMQHAGSGNRCMELHRQIYDIHNDIVDFYKRAEQLLDKQDGKPIGIPIENEFRYALRSYLDANQRTLKIVNDGKEEELLLQTQYQLLILHHDMVDFVEGRFRAAFYAMMGKYPPEAVARHLDIKQFHHDLSAIEEIIADSRKNRDNRHQLYSIMAEAGGTAEKMVRNFALLKKTESIIAMDAKKSRLQSFLYMCATAIIAALAGALITFILN